MEPQELLLEGLMKHQEVLQKEILQVAPIMLLQERRAELVVMARLPRSAK